MKLYTPEEQQKLLDNVEVLIHSEEYQLAGRILSELEIAAPKNYNIWLNNAKLYYAQIKAPSDLVWCLFKIRSCYEKAEKCNGGPLPQDVASEFERLMQGVEDKKAQCKAREDEWRQAELRQKKLDIERAIKEKEALENSKFSTGLIKIVALCFLLGCLALFFLYAFNG